MVAIIQSIYWMVLNRCTIIIHWYNYIKWYFIPYSNNNYTNYTTIKNDGTVTPLGMSPSLKVGIGTPIKSTWTCAIIEPSGCYVTLQVPEQLQ